MDSPKVPSAMEEAQAQIQLERERAALAKQQSDATAAAAKADKEAKIAKATGKQAQGYEQAVQYGNNQSANRGYDTGLVDKYNIAGLYRDTIDSTRRGFGEEDTNPVFGERSAYDDAVTQGQQRYRSDLNKQFKTFADEGFENTMFADTADDQLLEAILGTQREDVQAQVDAAKSRGTLNDVGYGKANQKLAQQTSAGRSSLQDLGLGVLGGYRNQLKTMAGNEKTKLNAATFADTYDPNSAQGKLTALRDQLGGRLEGDINKATSGQNFFDPSAILSYGGTQQGYYNPSTTAATGTNPLLETFVDPNKKASSLTSSTGTGAF